MLLWTLALVGNHPGSCWRNAGFSRDSTRLFTQVNRFLLSLLHFRRKIIPIARRKEDFGTAGGHIGTEVNLCVKAQVSPLKIELALQINQAIRCRRGKRPACQVVGLAQKWRTQIADWIAQVHLIKDISRVDTERNVVAVI
jgi:hypothetical protein